MSSYRQPRCAVRPGDPCTLCFPGATGPQDCGLVYLVRTDPELREELAALRAREAGQSGAITGPA